MQGEARRDLRSAENHRDANELVMEIVTVPQEGMVAEPFAVIRCQNDQRLIEKVLRAKLV